jgi:predicted CXXCH cytochrome family protein
MSRAPNRSDDGREGRSDGSNPEEEPLPVRNEPVPSALPRCRRTLASRLLGVSLLLFVAVPRFASAQAAPENIDPAKSCVGGGCHTTVANQPHLHWSNLSAPGECQRCHIPDGTLHDFETDDEADGCLVCHEQLAKRMSEGKLVHEAAEDDCLDCHDPHGSKAAALLVDVKGEDLSPLCFTCHEEDIVAEKYKHGPAALGACNMCHDPHVSNNRLLLLDRGADLCTGCHEELAQIMAEAEYLHDPAEDDCTDCHDPHSGPAPNMLPAEKRALCDECHDDIVEIAEGSPVPHSPTTTERECLGCHDPHASNDAPMLRKPQRDLCLSCHDRPIKSGDDTLINMAAWLDKHEVWHEPINRDNCTGCHRPHGGKHFRLLKKPFPANFYAPFKIEDYGLCFSCHEKTLVTSKSTRSLTNFRNGDQNLHFLHVNRSKRGRSCRACHELHASHEPLHIRERVVYGRWLMPINFQKTGTGGSCSPGCHELETYNRGAKDASTAKKK